MGRSAAPLHGAIRPTCGETSCQPNPSIHSLTGFGAAFSVVTTLLVWLNGASLTDHGPQLQYPNRSIDDLIPTPHPFQFPAKYGGAHITSEHFNTAGRSVRTGLIAAVVCSQWTWAATLLQSSNVAWQYGVSGPFWYGAGEWRVGVIVSSSKINDMVCC